MRLLTTCAFSILPYILRNRYHPEQREFPYQITRGTLPSVAMRKGASGVLVSDIAVGSLVIGEETTVADLACAVVAMNADWEEGDQITFFYGDLSLQAIFAADAPQGGGGNDDDNPGGGGGEGGDDPYNYGDD